MIRPAGSAREITDGNRKVLLSTNTLMSNINDLIESSIRGGEFSASLIIQDYPKNVRDTVRKILKAHGYRATVNTGYLFINW